MTIAIVDTSVLCEYLAVPSKCELPDLYRDEMAKRISNRESMLVPIVAVLETGNHIGQVANGGARFRVAQRFVQLVSDAIDGKAPFALADCAAADLRAWLDGFPAHAATGSGLGDLTIIEEWKRQKDRHRARRVYIWSLDEHLNGYDTGPRT